MIELMGGICHTRVSPGWFDRSTESTQFQKEKNCNETVPNSTNSYNCDKSNKNKKRINLKTKTLYLIRHAESNENRRQESLIRSLKRVANMKLPLRDDVAASVELLDMIGQLDSFVSEKGQKQIDQLASKLQMDDFVRRKGINVVAHSPLVRARQTCEGMLGCVTDRSASNVESLWEGKMAATVDRVVELPCLVERSPIETVIPVHHDKFIQRIDTFEEWLCEQPEDKIAVVGHSNFFKYMLNLPYKFGNCDVWEVKFNPSTRSALKQYGPKINVNGDTVEVVQEEHSQHFELLQSNLEDNESVFAGDNVCGELPRGWRNLVNLYTFEE